MSFVLRFVDVLTLLQVFPLGNAYFSQTTATALNATASSAKRILADGDRSPFRIRETVLFATPALRATSFCPSFVRFIARLIAAIRLSSSAMRGRCHGETLLTSGNRVATSRRPSAQKAEPCHRIDRRGESALGWLKKNGNRPHGAAGSLNHGAIIGHRQPYGLPLGFGLFVQVINGANFSKLMSNQRDAYHWLGCILVSERAHQSDPKHNVIAIDDGTFQCIWEDQGNLELPAGVDARVIGFEQAPYENGSVDNPARECMFLAIGHTFTEGWQWYGTTVPHIDATDLKLRNAKFADAMRRAYDISLPEPLPMIGVASEH